MTMSPDHMAAWRDYLAEELHQQHGTRKRDARREVTRWLRSLRQDAALPPYVVPETPPPQYPCARPAVRMARV